MSFCQLLSDFRPSKPTFVPKDYPDLTGKNVLITGTSAGVGKETARLLLSQNATIIAFNRNQEKAEKAYQDIKSQILESNPDSKGLDDRFIPITGDLADLTTIKGAANEIYSKVDKLDLAIFNAGVMTPPNGSVTKQGYELQFGTNVLGHQLLCKLVTPLIKKAKTEDYIPRVIFLSSIAHRNSPKDGIDYNRGFKDASNAQSVETYGQSKAGNIYQAAIFARENPDLISLAVHPGYLASELGRDLPAVFKTILLWTLYPPVYGSYTELFAALHPDITLKDSGRYIGPWGKFRPVRKDIEEGCSNGNAQRLWDTAENEVKSYV